MPAGTSNGKGGGTSGPPGAFSNAVQSLVRALLRLGGALLS